MPHRVGLIPASDVFVSSLRDWTRDNDALLIVDEVITFREEVGGMQARFTARPDLTAMAKIIGGGFPVGAVAGRDEVMSVFAATEHGIRLPHSGTFSANPVTMTAGRVAMELYDAPAVERLNRLGDVARSRISEAIALSGAPASVTGSGSLFRIHMRAEPPVDYRSAYQDRDTVKTLNRFIDGVYDGGIMMLNTAAVPCRRRWTSRNRSPRRSRRAQPPNNQELGSRALNTRIHCVGNSGTKRGSAPGRPLAGR